MAKTERTQAAERRVLKKYLTRFFRAKEKQKTLQRRAEAIRADLGEASALEARVQAQAKAAERSALEIMDILDLLPEDATERTILELRHLDCKPWREINRTVYLTASPCFEYYNRGLDTLLSMEQVRKTLGLAQD